MPFPAPSTLAWWLIPAVLLAVVLQSGLPLRYNARNVIVRWRSTLATVLGIGLVVAVYVLLQALAQGIERNSGNTGDPRNVLVVRKGSQAESSSLVTREQFRALLYLDEIARNDRDEPVISADVITLVSATRFDRTGDANLLVRGISPRGIELRPQVRLTDGRWFTPGRREVVVAARLARRFDGLQVGGKLKAGSDHLVVVGHFSGGGSAFDSEAWMDADEARTLFDREMYSSLLIRPRTPELLTSLVQRIEGDKRFALRAEPETEYYRKQTMTAVPIRWLARMLGMAMSVGAVFAAMNTMYASVGSRTREIGTLRVLGFSRRSIVVSFLIEGALLALLGGAAGCLAALPMHGYATGTLDFQSFSETVFEFTITPGLAFKGLVFSVIVGVLGSLLPALRASRIPVISALKSV